MNNKGFAVSSVIYSILIIFIMLVFGTLSILGSRKLILDKVKNDVMNELNGDVADTNVYRDNSGANTPELYNNMLPVKYENNNWVIADNTLEWYDYNKKEWANAVVLNTGVVKRIGDVLNLNDDVAQMYVWIPRYKYTIFNGNNESAEPQKIEIRFENSRHSTGSVYCTDNIGTQDYSETCTDINGDSIVNGTSTYTHPAFTFGEKSLKGIWVGKFENSAANVENNEIQDIIIKPNVISWRNTQVGTFFISISNISRNYSINADSRMMKNMEWGAVAYLTQSKYGRCTSESCIEVSINNSTNYYTGRSAGEPGSSSTTVSIDGTYTYESINGVLSSTTGNVYGIYDMVGGSWEYVMGNMVNSSGTFYERSAGTLNLDAKYYDAYSYDSLSLASRSRGKLGDATKETLAIYENVTGGWYNDCVAFPYSSYPWFIRGGIYADGGAAGIFLFNGTDGNAGSTGASRTVISE